MPQNNKSNYELVFILSEDKEEIHQKIEQWVSELTGQIENKLSMGKKIFCYPIKKEKDGYYFSLNVTIAQNHVKELTKKLDFDTDVLRYLLIKTAN